MATTIKLKNGSGAPAASDLVQGEPAFDLTNKRLYTENGSGAVIEIGTVPSTIDINAGTIDGAVIGGASAAVGTFTTANATTVDTTNIEVTNLKAKDGTAAGSIADSTGVVTVASAVLTTADINGGTADAVVIGGSSAAVGTFTTANATTVDTTNLEVTNLKAKDGTAAGSIADSTGVVTLASSVLTTADINGGTADGVTIGGSTAAAGTFTTFTSTGIDDNATSTALTITNSGIAATLTTAAQPNVTSVGTLTGFASTGIDDNATSTAITIDSSENVAVGGNVTVTGSLLAKQSGAGANAFAAGASAGLTSQGTSAVAVGHLAGKTSQTDYAVAVGYNAGATSQSEACVAVGVLSGTTNQGDNGIAIGGSAGNSNQSRWAVGIGQNAGQTSQGESAVAIGRQAGQTNQAANGIIISSAGSAINNTNSNHIQLQSAPTKYLLYNGSNNWTFSGGSLYVGSSFVSSSDQTLKGNITTAPSDMVGKLTGREWNWKSNGEKGSGVVAQELEEHLPHLVVKNDEGIKGVNYSGLSGYLIEAIKEQKAMIETLQSEVAELKGA